MSDIERIELFSMWMNMYKVIIRNLSIVLGCVVIFSSAYLLTPHPFSAHQVSDFLLLATLSILIGIFCILKPFDLYNSPDLSLGWFFAGFSCFLLSLAILLMDALPHDVTSYISINLAVYIGLLIVIYVITSLGRRILLNRLTTEIFGDLEPILYRPSRSVWYKWLRSPYERTILLVPNKTVSSEAYAQSLLSRVQPLRCEPVGRTIVIHHDAYTKPLLLHIDNY